MSFKYTSPKKVKQMSFEITQVHEEVLASLLLKTEPFDQLDSREIRRLVVAAKRIYVKKGCKIYKPGDNASHLYILVDGAIKLCSSNSSGKEVIHDMFNGPSVIGLNNFCLKRPIDNSAISISSLSTCYAISFDLIRELMLENNNFNLKLFSHISSCIQKKEKRIEQLMLNDARERVIEFIRQYALENGIRIGYEILLKNYFTQQELADYTGTSRQTVTNILKSLKERDRIKVSRKSILIRDINKLR